MREKITDTVIYSTILFFFVTPVHEFWHYWVGTWLGGSGFSVTFSDLFSGLCSFTTPVHHAPWLFYLSGGLLTGLMLLAVGWRALRTPSKWDESLLYPAMIFGGAQIGYSIGEISLYYAPHYFWYCAGTGSALGALPFALWRSRKFLGWITSPNPT
jgi:hypothetical protein